jgi:hypothetical protein
MRVALARGHENPDIQSYEIAPRIASDVGEVLVEVANEAVIIDEGGPAGQRLEQILRLNMMILEVSHGRLTFARLPVPQTKEG